MAEYEYDYDGDFGVFQRRLAKAGVSPDEFDITNYAGLTYSELNSITNRVCAWKEKQLADKK